MQPQLGQDLSTPCLGAYAGRARQGRTGQARGRSGCLATGAIAATDAVASYGMGKGEGQEAPKARTAVAWIQFYFREAAVGQIESLERLNLACGLYCAHPCPSASSQKW